MRGNTRALLVGISLDVRRIDVTLVHAVAKNVFEQAFWERIRTRFYCCGDGARGHCLDNLVPRNGSITERNRPDKGRL